MTPVIFAVGNEYQITLAVQEEMMLWVRVGEETFYDADNGILRSDKGIRKVSVPLEIMNKEKRYTIFRRKVLERKAYFTETEEMVLEDFEFYPVEGESIRAFHIADVHNRDASSVKAAKAFGKMDFLIFNGDIPNHCDEVDNIYSIYRIASEITHGNIPVVFSRGNHDMRGKYAEYFSKYVPQCQGKFYFTFRLGTIWGMVLDCGEDKLDGNEEYGNTICCGDFRKEETKFIENIISNACKEYDAPDVTYKMVISHIPFTKKFDGVFDIESDIYAHWTALLREQIKPQFMLCAHEHMINVYEPGSPMDAYGQLCPVIIGAEVSSVSKPLPEDYYAGAGLTFQNGDINIEFIDAEGKNLREYHISKSNHIN